MGLELEPQVLGPGGHHRSVLAGLDVRILTEAPSPAVQRLGAGSGQEGDPAYAADTRAWISFSASWADSAAPSCQALM